MQDVFVLQTQGRKRWRVYRPPPPARLPRADPFARGKGADELSTFELDAPLIDVVLRPGQLLYVPAGFPHTTDTEFVTSDEGNSGDGEEREASLHMTLGVDSLIWGLTYAGLRAVALKRAAQPDKLLLTKLPPNLYWQMQVL